MALPMMHLLIADKIYAEKSSSIHSYGEFLLGSIAPDAIHAKENWTRGLKNISHYRFYGQNQISYFDTFIDEYHTSESKDFVVGYLVHLLSDMIWLRSIRRPFEDRFLKAPSSNMSMNEAYYADCDQIEQLMFWEKNTSHIIEAITKSKAYSLEGLIDAENVIIWREKLISDYDGKAKSLPHTIYISEQQIRDYITNCARECSEYLRNLDMKRL